MCLLGDQNGARARSVGPCPGISHLRQWGRNRGDLDPPGVELADQRRQLGAVGLARDRPLAGALDAQVGRAQSDRRELDRRARDGADLDPVERRGCGRARAVSSATIARWAGSPQR